MVENSEETAEELADNRKLTQRFHFQLAGETRTFFREMFWGETADPVLREAGIAGLAIALVWGIWEIVLAPLADWLATQWERILETLGEWLDLSDWAEKTNDLLKEAQDKGIAWAEENIPGFSLVADTVQGRLDDGRKAFNRWIRPVLEELDLIVEAPPPAKPTRKEAEEFQRQAPLKRQAPEKEEA